MKTHNPDFKDWLLILEFLHHVVIKCSVVSEEHIVSLRLVGLVQVDAKEMQWQKICQFYRKIWGT